MAQDAIYLRITFRNNDYTNSLRLVGMWLQSAFNFIGAYPAEEELPFLRSVVMRMWLGAEGMLDVMLHREYVERDTEYFHPRLEFVSFKDIRDNENLENVYIPMFDGEILVR